MSCLASITSIQTRMVDGDAGTTKKLKFPLSYWRYLKHRTPNLPIILILFYSIPISMSVTICQSVIYRLITTKPAETSCFSPIEEVELDYVYIARLVESLCLFLAYPISGWLADTKLGRGLAINVSLWLCWLGMLAITCSYLVQYSACGLLYNIFKYIISSLGLFLMMLGMADFHTNALAYMMDQMPDASTNQIITVIRWFTWTLLFGFCVDYLEVLQISKLNHDVILGTFFLTFTLLSVMLFVHQFTMKVNKPIKRNPYKLIYTVLLYAWKNKRAGNRSSLTYWEEKIPSRIDLGKQRYGGPFLEEDVENVKSFGKVVIIFLLLGGVFIPYFDLANQGPVYGRQYKDADSVDGYSSYLLWQPFVMIGVIIIPIVEFVMIPTFPKFEYFFTSPLRGLIVAHGLAITAILALLGIQLGGFFSSESGIDCYLSVQFPVNVYNLSFTILIIPCLFIGIYVYLTFSQTFQVICSQAPHEMSGMIMGMFWFTRGIYISIGTLFSFVTPLFSGNRTDIPPCTFWVLLMLLVVSVCGTIVFMIFVRLYSARERGTVFNTQHVIESHYTKYLDSISNQTNKYNYNINSETIKLSGWSDNVIPHD